MLEFYIGSAPQGFKKNFESFLFNSRTHRNTQSKSGWIEFHLLDTRKKLIQASVAFHISNSTAKSPMLAPFGGFEIALSLKTADLLNFIAEIEKYFLSISIQSIEITGPPELLSQNQTQINSALHHCEYHSQLDVGCCIMVDETPLELKMMTDKVIRLRKGQESGLIFKIIPNSKLKSVYQFIETNFEKLNRELSLPYGKLNQIVKKFPGKFLLAGAFSNHKLVAAVVCIHISPTIIYNFYTAHDKHFNKISPRIYLMNELYHWCQKHKIKVIDLGTSMLKKKINVGLLDFKIRLGGVVTNKMTFTKNI